MAEQRMMLYPARAKSTATFEGLAPYPAETSVPVVVPAGQVAHIRIVIDDVDNSSYATHADVYLLHDATEMRGLDFTLAFSWFDVIVAVAAILAGLPWRVPAMAAAVGVLLHILRFSNEPVASTTVLWMATLLGLVLAYARLDRRRGAATGV